MRRKAAMFHRIPAIAAAPSPSDNLVGRLRFRRPAPPEEAGAGRDVALVVALKAVVQPLIAYVTARFILGLDGTALPAATLFAALPTAQNVYAVT
ncbi:hypothetical protein LDL08_09080 [Nonomuraea glycinis]|nr:hypothetical protein [Nonomuraea glycinis]MCA2176335.1 hypothetical protein [Nonomuraea glycinis]